MVARNRDATCPRSGKGAFFNHSVFLQSLLVVEGRLARKGVGGWCYFCGRFPGPDWMALELSAARMQILVRSVPVCEQQHRVRYRYQPVSLESRSRVLLLGNGLLILNVPYHVANSKDFNCNNGPAGTQLTVSGIVLALKKKILRKGGRGRGKEGGRRQGGRQEVGSFAPNQRWVRETRVSGDMPTRVGTCSWVRVCGFCW